MIIERIEIKSFGQLTDMTLEFSDKINVIEGQNEAGKSTIAAFIKYMLYGFETTESKDTVGERKKRINWNTGVAEGSMTVCVGGKKYLITRSTVQVDNSDRTSYKEDSSIIDLESGTPAFGKLPAGEVFFGVDRELFENTAFIGQVGDTSISEGSVKQSIENILFSGSERINTQRAANRIAEKMETLLHQGNTGGAIMDLIKKQDELTEKLRATDEDNKRILAKEAELHEIRMRKKEAEDRCKGLGELDACYCNVKIIQSFDELHKYEEELDRKTEAYNEFLEANTVNGFVPTNDYITDIALAKRSVDDSYRRVEDAQRTYAKERSAIGITREIESAIELSDSLGGEEKIREAINGYSMNKIKCLFGGIGALLVAIAALVAIIAAASMAPVAKVFLGILGVLALGGAGVLTYFCIGAAKGLGELSSKFGTESTDELREKISVIASARSKRDALVSSTENARVALEGAKVEYEAAKNELSRVASRWSEEPAMTDGASLKALEERVRKFLHQRGALLEDKTRVEIAVKEIRRTLSDKSEIEIRGKVSPLKRKVISEIDHDEILTSIEEANAVIAEQERLSFNVESELADLKMRARDPGELYSKIQALDTKINELGAKHKAYFVALKAINSASDNLRREISPRLGEFSTELLKIMTDRKYSELDINDELKVTFTTGDGKEKSVDYLSGGTRDLTYIAVRMALIDMLYTEKPPICFDETFANQDNARAASMMRAIKKLSDDGYQSYVFTCRQREAGIASELQPRTAIFKLSITGE
ncbi:MAG: AAA family ATPase [Clostridia bacterium]|nr:AAA family ATPase [Clostridia bacterium]